MGCIAEYCRPVGGGRVNTAVAGWWARVDKYNSKHWLTKMLAVAWNAIEDAAPGTALRPPGTAGPLGGSGPCVLEGVQALQARLEPLVPLPQRLLQCLLPAGPVSEPVRSPRHSLTSTHSLSVVSSTPNALIPPSPPLSSALAPWSSAIQLPKEWPSPLPPLFFFFFVCLNAKAL